MPKAIPEIIPININKGVVEKILSAATPATSNKTGNTTKPKLIELASSKARARSAHSFFCITLESLLYLIIEPRKPCPLGSGFLTKKVFKKKLDDYINKFLQVPFQPRQLQQFDGDLFQF